MAGVASMAGVLSVTAVVAVLRVVAVVSMAVTGVISLIHVALVFLVTGGARAVLTVRVVSAHPVVDVTAVTGVVV
ncbi:hypothetical protein ACFS27_18150 [Promicromonospora vindobonensis]|uniref:Uncharacterized protein n=1 Tax=Promicromonospora vindobonensis TaxID=195748 RepID=A0ABW5VWR6_9MICO